MYVPSLQYVYGADGNFTGSNYALLFNETVQCLWVGEDGISYNVEEMIGLAALVFEPLATSLTASVPPAEVVGSVMLFHQGHSAKLRLEQGYSQFCLTSTMSGSCTHANTCQ